MSRTPSNEPVLELRIHGVKNTPAAEMLEVPPDGLTQTRGDELGGFWLPTSHPPNAPPGVRREAYSWGRMARAGGAALPLLGQFLVHIGWLLILPFGLCNVAYWTQRIRPQTIRLGWVVDRSAALIRMFALGLTLLYTTALASVSLDLIGVQCFPPEGVCAQLPTAFDFLAAMPRGPRLALLSALPLGVMLLLYVVARRGRVRYEARVKKMAEALAESESEDWPALATPGFWSEARLGPTTERLHFAAVVFLMAMLLAWDSALHRVPGCTLATLAGCLNPGALPPADAGTWALGVLGAIGLVLVGAFVWQSSETPADRARMRWRRTRAGLLLVAACILFAAVVAAVITAAATAAGVPGAARPNYVLGLIVTPKLIVGLLLAVALTALGFRRGTPLWLSLSLLTAAALALAAPAAAPDVAGPFAPALASLAAVLVVCQLLAVALWGRRDPEHQRTAWAGTGPGVVLLLALGAAMVIVSLLVVGVGSWLGAPIAAAETENAAFRQPAERVPPVQQPTAYVEFGAALLAVLAVIAVVVTVTVLRHMAGLRVLRSARLRAWRSETEDVCALPVYGQDGPPRPTTDSPLEMRVLRGRRFAAVAHLAEPLLAWVAGGFAFAAAVAVVPSTSAARAGEPRPVSWLQSISEAAGTAAPAVAITTLGASALGVLAAVAANALTTKERPVGLLWDLICFLPRAGHPFGPPCYAERVVPEVSGRISEWLGDGPALSRRKVVLSAHSLGGVLAVSVLFARYSIEEQRPLERIGLITYGTQLRPFFGRFFPELFGSRVLGTRPCGRPRLLARDPWRRQIDEDEAADQAVHRSTIQSPTLAGLLGRGQPGWVNVWRRTDFLGFPVHSYSNDAANPIDRGATELEPGPYGKVATHSNYPATWQYRAALEELIARI
jgi:hypothetical protein